MDLLQELTSSLFCFRFPVKSLQGTPKVKGALHQNCLQKERTKQVKEKSKKRHRHQKRAKRTGKDDLISTPRLSSNGNNRVKERLGFYAWLFNLLTVGPGVSVSSCKDGSWTRLALKGPSIPKILFVLPHRLESGSWPVLSAASSSLKAVEEYPLD